MHDMRAFVCIKGYFVRLTKMKGCLVSFEILKKIVAKTSAKSIFLFLIFGDRGRHLYFLKIPPTHCNILPKDVCKCCNPFSFRRHFFNGMQHCKLLFHALKQKFEWPCFYLLQPIYELNLVFLFFHLFNSSSVNV